MEIALKEGRQRKTVGTVFFMNDIVGKPSARKTSYNI